jgi:uncharacterized membrane protein
MLSIIIQITALLFLPGLILYLKRRSKVIRWVGPIVVCYLAGILAGNLSFLELNNELMSKTAEISVCLAIPILLFSCDVGKWLHHSKNTFISFSLAIVAVIITSSTAFFIFRDQIADSWKIAGMMIGVYSGATVNMTAIGVALNVPEEVFVMVNSADLIFGGIYFFFLITLSKKIFKYILPKFKNNNENHGSDSIPAIPTEIKSSPGKIISQISISLGLSLIILGISSLISFLLTGGLSPTVLILAITAFGIAFSFNNKIKKLKYTYESGDYLLLIFALAIGSMANFYELVTANLFIMLYCAFVVFGSALLHVVAASLFRLEDDTVIINSAAALFGPAFILPVAEAINNKEIIVPGLAMALLGNAIGTYLGLAVAWSLNYLS